MGFPRFVGAGVALALVGGALTAAPTFVQPAQAATVVTPVTAAKSKPRITKQPKAVVVASPGKTVKLTVKATGGSLKYQWFYATSSDTTARKVAGAAGKKATLKVKASLGKAGYSYRAVVYNAKGKKYSRVIVLAVRSTFAKPFKAKAIGVTGHWVATAVTSSIDVGTGTTAVVAQIPLGNYTSKARNPKSDLTITFKTKGGKVYGDQNATGEYYTYGLKTAGKIGKDSIKRVYAVAFVPTTNVAGGRWIIKDKNSPAVTLYFAQ